MSSTAVSRGHRRFYVTFVVLLVVWIAVLMAIAVTVIPDAYWYSYYSVDYSLGFVRRGLAGELTGLFPSRQYFTALRILRWFPTVFFTTALAALAWTVAVRSGRSDRRVLLALLIPVLPFGFAFGLFSARTDLFGATALIAFAIALPSAKTDRSVMIASAGYGLLTAGLALIHEAIPFLFGLGAVVALSVLSGHVTRGAFRISTALALAPGWLTAVAISVFSTRGISGQLCRLVPHGPTNHPLAGKPTVGQLLRGFKYYVDYHDLICRNILPLFDQNFGDAMRFVASLGAPALIGSTVFGIAVLAISIMAIDHVSGVPFGRFRDVLGARRIEVLIGFAVMMPVFLTGVDWVRWWVMISFDLGIVYLLYAATQPEVDSAPTRRTLTVFAVGVVLLAIVPLGIIPGFGAPVPM